MYDHQNRPSFDNHNRVIRGRVAQLESRLEQYRNPGDDKPPCPEDRLPNGVDEHVARGDVSAEEWLDNYDNRFNGMAMPAPLPNPVSLGRALAGRGAVAGANWLRGLLGGGRAVTP